MDWTGPYLLDDDFSFQTGLVVFAMPTLQEGFFGSLNGLTPVVIKLRINVAHLLC